MNSDFMQIEAEELAKRTASETSTRARVRKLYQLAYGREATEPEIGLALEYLKAEPMMEYDEFKNQKSATSTPSTDIKSNINVKPANNNEPTIAADMPPDMPAATDDAEAADAGMMAGVPGFGARGGQTPAIPQYTPTPLGRYAKVLLSSTEFMFIN